MKKWLKYLLPLMVVGFFWNCKDNPVSSVLEEDSATYVICDVISGDVISTPETEFCLPRQISFAGPSQVQTSARRTSGNVRFNFEFVKSGKILNSGLRYFIQNKSIISKSSLMEPSCMLLYLGKLII